jgi:hypothetical protein
MNNSYYLPYPACTESEYNRLLANAGKAVFEAACTHAAIQPIDWDQLEAKQIYPRGWSTECVQEPVPEYTNGRCCA